LKKPRTAKNKISFKSKIINIEKWKIREMVDGMDLLKRLTLGFVLLVELLFVYTVLTV